MVGELITRCYSCKAAIYETDLSAHFVVLQHTINQIIPTLLGPPQKDLWCAINGFSPQGIIANFRHLSRI